MTMLERMSGNDKRIFEIKKIGDGEFRIREECDNYFADFLTADELEQLGQEIIDLARKSKDEKK